MNRLQFYLAAASLCGCLFCGNFTVRAADADSPYETRQAGESDLKDGQDQEPETSSDGSEVQCREIRTPQELLDMAAYPFGHYRLMSDIDMTGVSWKPLAFCGTFDGNGFAILNLEISDVGKDVEKTYDGNMKEYDTSFAGFFDTLKGAYITDLQLINLRINAVSELPCFVGGIAGYMENSTIENSSIQGILQLRACDRMFGVGGVIGYGCGSIKNTEADVTLVCIDTDAETKDEQFMGGVCAAGYPDINGCSVILSGFDSDHGYVHDGGLVGMYMFYPRGTKYYGSITDNQVTGKITFFEDNNNRRAYCSGFIGEIMNWDFENGRNRDDFVRDERFEYDTDLLPHSCESALTGDQGIFWEETVTAPGCETFGYTEKRCAACGYTETDHYTLKSHQLSWQTLREATTQETGLERGTCKVCGYSQERELAKLEPTPEPTAAPEPASDQEVMPAPESPRKEKNGLYAAFLSVLLVAAAGVIIRLITKKGKKRRK